MFFDKIAIAVISPLGTAIILGLLAWFLLYKRIMRAGLILFSLAWVWLFICSLPAASYALRASLESAFPPIAMEKLAKAPVIVVLGGGIDPSEQDGGPPNLLSAADRVWYAAKLFHAGKAPLILLSGGNDPKQSSMSEAAAMRLFLLDLGVPSANILLEKNSRNTRQNAIYSAELLKSRKISQIILVTSALHMQRSIALFEATGLQVIAAASDYEAKSKLFWRDFLPNAEALDGSARAMKEIIGRATQR